MFGLNATHRDRGLGHSLCRATSPAERKRMSRLTRAGVVERRDRGLYEWVDGPPTANLELLAVALRQPEAVLCLTTALSFHELTDQLPLVTYIGLEAGQRTPRWTWPRITAVPLAASRWPEGIDTLMLDGVPVRMTDPTRSVADAWRYESLVGRDVCIEATKSLLRERRGTPGHLAKHLARYRLTDHVRPVIEGLLA